MDFANSNRPTQPNESIPTAKQNVNFIFDLTVFHERCFRYLEENFRLLFCLMQFVQYLC